MWFFISDRIAHTVCGLFSLAVAKLEMHNDGLRRDLGSGMPLNFMPVYIYFAYVMHVTEYSSRASLSESDETSVSHATLETLFAGAEAVGSHVRVTLLTCTISS